MKIVIAPDSYKESLSASEVAQAIEKGFREIFPDAQYVSIPVADGGEGTVKDDEILEIVVNQYRAVGGGNYPMFSADKIVREITVDMTELIADYLKKHPIIEASVNHNFTVLK